MGARHTPTVSELRHEARSLRHLLRSYLDDRSFIHKSQSARLLYFVDAHEIKSYIDPISPESLVGFILKAEQAVIKSSAAQFDLAIRLKSDQLLRELLFNPARQVGILPSHAEEVDEEIAFREHHWLSERLCLLDKARDEVRRLRDTMTPRRLLAFAAAEPNNPTRKRAVVDFFMTAAPALMALLRPNADKPQARINALIDTSNLVRLGDLAWEEFGFDRVTCKQLRGVRPDRTDIERWRRYFEGRRERRKNSNRANRIDAEAVAFIQALNAKLNALPGPRVNARLVTRAMTLISGASDRDAVRKAGLREADFLRHSRLLALEDLPNGRGAKRGAHEAVGRLDGQESEQTLIVALHTYQRQLKSLGRNAIRPGDTEMRTAVEMLVKAWDEFEMARLTLDLRSESGSSFSDDTIGDVEFQRLMEWFRNDADVLKLLNEEVLRAVQQFGEATFALSQAGYSEPVLVQVIPLDRPNRSRVFPMIAGSPGPVDLFAPGLRGARGRHCPLEGLLADLESNAAERYITWALLFACQRRWELARIYANSAVQIAKLLPGHEAERAIKEAILLRSQILRLGADEGRAKDVRKRLESSLAGLTQFEGEPDARIARERAAQILELRLSVPPGEMAHVQLAFGHELLHTALEHCGEDELLRTRILELGLNYHLAGRDQPELWPDRTDGDRVVVKQWHNQLHKILEAQRRTMLPQAISRRARAMELIGFQLFVERNNDVAEFGASEPPIRIPSHLRLDVTELRDQIGRSIDASASLIAKELETIDRRLESFRIRDLIYAPVWADDGVQEILQMIEDSQARALADSAYSDLIAIAGASQQMGVHSDQRRPLERIANDFQRALDALQGAGLATNERVWRASFYLRMECCYARLLLTQLTPDRWRRQELTNLASDYSEIAKDFPTASIPHFRLDTVLSELNESNEAMKAIGRARELVDADPFLLPPNHWVRSTIRRRIAMRSAQAAAWQREKLQAAPADQRLRTEYVSNLIKAFEDVYVGFDALDDSDANYLHRLEARQRTSSIVYYASCLLKEDSEGAGLHRFGFGPDELRHLLGRLHPDGIERVIEPNVVHTIGCAYAVLGQTLEATNAGRRLITLMAQRGDDPKDRAVARMLTDAFTWLRDAGIAHENKLIGVPTQGRAAIEG